MTDVPRRSVDWTSPEMRRRISARRRNGVWFQSFGLAAIGFAGLMLLVLVGSITSSGIGGFIRSEVNLSVALDSAVLGDPASLETEEGRAAFVSADFGRILRESLMAKFPDVRGRRDVRRLSGILSSGARSVIREYVLTNPEQIGETVDIWMPTSDDIDQYVKGNVDATLPEGQRRVSDREIGWVETFRAENRLEKRFNSSFFTSGDSREPELAGVGGAIVGTILTLLVTLAIAFPIGILTAVYLEEFAPKNRLTDLIEVNINNLAAVPSIVFGLLGLAIFLGTWDLPRSAPLVGGLTLALMTLPTIIIAGRVSIQAVPPSIREAAIALGATSVQATLHHVAPLAMPGILTGTIIGMARALGETAPLLMIGMVAFIVDIPKSFTDAATVLPVQVFLWADSPERAFVEKTSAAIMVLLAFLIIMNALAVWLRGRFEQDY